MTVTQVACSPLGGTLVKAEEESKVGEDELCFARLVDLLHLVPHIDILLGTCCVFYNVLTFFYGKCNIRNENRIGTRLHGWGKFLFYPQGMVMSLQ